MLNEIGKRINEQMGITLNVTSTAKKYLVDTGYDKKYGARPLRRALVNKIEDPLAEEILAGKIKANDTVKVTLSGKNIKFTVDGKK